MNKTIKIIIFSLALMLILSPIMAQAATFDFDPDNRIINEIGGEVTTADPEDITISTLQWLLGTLGLIAVVINIYAGFLWMTAAGNDEKITKAKQILTYAAVGLVVIFISWALVNFIFTNINRVA